MIPRTDELAQELRRLRHTVLAIAIAVLLIVVTFLAAGALQDRSADRVGDVRSDLNTEVTVAPADVYRECMDNAVLTHDTREDCRRKAGL